MDWDEPLTSLKGIGPAAAAALARLGLTTCRQLALYWPRRHDDYSKISPISQLRPGPVSIKATITAASGRHVRRGLHITEAIASDSSGSVRLVWFNQSFRSGLLKSGQHYFIAGNYQLRYRRFSIDNPAIEPAGNWPLNTARIVPIYRETEGLGSLQIRRLINLLLPYFKDLQETLPDWLLAVHDLLPLAAAARAMHYPESSGQLSAARRRLAFEEIFGLVLASLLNKAQNARQLAPGIDFNQPLARQIVAKLPFKLTADQRRAVWQIYQDMAADSSAGGVRPMNRLVMGDVGSGKTVVAAMSAAMVAASGHQVALMAPTEVLARQHFKSLQWLLKPAGLAGRLRLLIGSQKLADKRAVQVEIKTGQPLIVVGTHTLIAQEVTWPALGLAVVDEQHRFGVRQRLKMQAASKSIPHSLTMTATPIPRSLALTLYGELDISRLKEHPHGRNEVGTTIVPPSGRPAVYGHMQKQLAAGRQVFVVCPAIGQQTVTSRPVEVVYDELRRIFKEYRVEQLHGRQAAGDKEDLMSRFAAGDINILVCTTLIEVGLDVPNASCLVVEDAEHFGLAQLHQLRGRVGRAGQAAQAFFMTDKTPSRRLRALGTVNDGFRLAELDLELRGPGALYGRAQHGPLDLTLADFNDLELIAAARRGANEFLTRREKLLKYPQLASRVRRLRAITVLN